MNEVDEMRMKGWITIIQTCNASGQPKKEWCEENGVDIRKFYYWQKRIREELYKELQDDELFPALPEGIQPGPVFAEVAVPPVQPEQNRQERQPSAVLKVGTVTIEIFNTASKTLLENMWRMMRHVV